MKGLLSLLIFSMVLPAHAGIVIYGTRIIYPAENKEVMVQLMNQGNRSSLLQAWIDEAIRHYHQKNSGSFHVNATSGKNRSKFRAASKNQNYAE